MGRSVFNGDMVDNVPAYVLGAIPNDTFVLVTCLYPRPTHPRMDVSVLNGVQRHPYVQPPCKVPISS